MRKLLQYEYYIVDLYNREYVCVRGRSTLKGSRRVTTQPRTFDDVEPHAFNTDIVSYWLCNHINIDKYCNEV